jgi:aminoglycoside phosphotransferase (APT) family kinase protein
MISTEKNPRATTIAAAEPKDTAPSGDARHAAASERHPSAIRDLRPANILVDDGQVSGVIDFGDITSCDPASDLSVAWMLLPPACHAGLWSAYQAVGGRASAALRARARGWALNLAIVFLAHSEDNPVLREVGRRTLRTVLEDQRGPAG